MPSMWQGRVASGERQPGEGGLQAVFAVRGQTGPARASQSALTIFASRAMRTKRDSFHACQACGKGVWQAERDSRAKVGCKRCLL